MNFKDSLKRNDYNTVSIIIFSIHTIIFYFIFMIGRERERERGGREERVSERERREKREEREKGERQREKGSVRERERDSKLLKEKQSQEISCLRERLFLVKISLKNPSKSNLSNNPSKFEWFSIPWDFF